MVDIIRDKKTESLVFQGEIPLSPSLKFKGKLYTSDGITPIDADLHLIYDPLTGLYVPNKLRSIFKDAAWQRLSFHPTSILIMQGRTQEAVALAELEAAEMPDSYKAWNRSAGAHSWNDNHEAALKAANKAIELAPEQAFLYQNKAIDLANLGRYEEAIESIDQRIKMEPDFIYAHAIKAEFLLQQGRTQEAYEAYEKALTSPSSYDLADKHRRMIAHELGFESIDQAREHVNAGVQSYKTANLTFPEAMI